MYNTSNGRAMLISCVALAIFGGIVGYYNKPKAVASNTTPEVVYVQKADLPLDLQLSLGKDKTIEHKEPATFAIEVNSSKPKVEVRYKTKIRTVGVPEESVDSLVKMRADSLATALVRERQTSDSMRGPKPSITLIENGEVIYKRQ